MRHNKVCWNCGKDTMVNKGDYYQCSECGATWNELPTLGAFIDIQRRPGGMDGTSRYEPVKKRVRVAVKPKPRPKH